MMQNKDKSFSPKISRRQFLKITAAAGTLAAGGVFLGRQMLPRLTTLQETRLLMGTLINLAVITNNREQGRAAIEATFARMQRLIGYFDHRQPGSLVTRLNQTGQLNNAPPELVDIVAQALEYGRLTDGAFDISVKPLLDVYRAGNRNVQASLPLVNYRQIKIEGSRIAFEQPGMAITLDSIAKGRVVDAATAVLKSGGFDNILVEAGGDLLANGNRADGSPWRVGIANPRQSTETDILSVLPVAGQAVATSGDYMNSFTSDFSLHHIVDPRTGVSPANLASVTVVAPTATAADALSTAVMVMGSAAGLSLLNTLPQVEALAITKDMQMHQTTGFTNT